MTNRASETSGGGGMGAIRRFLTGEEGPTMAEYAVMLALVIGGLIAVITATGNVAADWWESNEQAVSEAVSSAGAGGSR